MIRRTLPSFTLCTLALALTFLGAGRARPADAQGNLVVQAATEPPGLDLTATPASATAAVLYNVQECLVKGDRHAKLVPWLAERWHTPSSSSGASGFTTDELTAADAKFVIERAMNPATKHLYPGYYSAIGDILVKDDYAVTISLKSTDASLIIQASTSFPVAILAEVALAYLGLGTRPPRASWGLMLKGAQNFLSLSPSFALFPGGAIALTVLGLNLLGDGLRDLLDPKTA